MINKVLLSALLLATLACCNTFTLFAKPDVYSVPVREESEESTQHRPRMPKLLPFSAYADSDAGELILCANSGCGIIHFSIVNTLSGDAYSSQSTALYQGDIFSYSIPWQSGQWKFTFILDTGSIYYGQLFL